MTFGEIRGDLPPELDWGIGGDEIYWGPIPWIPHLEKQRLPCGYLLPDAASLVNYWDGKWEDRNWRNVPGPIYAGQTDNTGVGPASAPRHFLHGDDYNYGAEFLYRQPRTLGELRDVVGGADQDPWLGWACDGDEHWTYPAVREWWRERARVEEWVDRASAEATDRLARPVTDEKYRAVTEAARAREVAALADYRSYLRSDLEAHLRAYSFWLEERRSPAPEDTLPDL